MGEPAANNWNVDTLAAPTRVKSQQPLSAWLCAALHMHVTLWKGNPNVLQNFGMCRDYLPQHPLGLIDIVAVTPHRVIGRGAGSLCGIDASQRAL
jgi:hypothetical protein